MAGYIAISRSRIAGYFAHQRNRAASAVAVVGLLFGLGGCEPPGPQQTASSCYQQQKSVSAWFGDALSKGSRAVVGMAPSQVQPFVGAIDIPGVVKEGSLWLGPQIACSLNNPNDRKKAEEAVKVATSTGHVTTWSGSEPGVSGSAKVIQSDALCRTVQQTVTLSDGTQRAEDVKSCKGAAGWEVVQS